jgi:hypothetical protein
MVTTVVSQYWAPPSESRDTALSTGECQNSAALLPSPKLPLNPLKRVVSIYTTCFSIKNPTCCPHCITASYVFRAILTINSDCFPKQHSSSAEKRFCVTPSHVAESPDVQNVGSFQWLWRAEVSQSVEIRADLSICEFAVSSRKPSDAGQGGRKLQATNITATLQCRLLCHSA